MPHLRPDIETLRSVAGAGRTAADRLRRVEELQPPDERAQRRAHLVRGLPGHRGPDPLPLRLVCRPDHPDADGENRQQQHRLQPRNPLQPAEEGGLPVVHDEPGRLVHEGSVPGVEPGDVGADLCPPLLRLDPRLEREVHGGRRRSLGVRDDDRDARPIELAQQFELPLRREPLGRGGGGDDLEVDAAEHGCVPSQLLRDLPGVEEVGDEYGAEHEQDRHGQEPSPHARPGDHGGLNRSKPVQGRRASGIRTLPSGSRCVSRSATRVRASATPEPLRV